MAASSLQCCKGSSLGAANGATLCYRAPHCGGFSCLRAQAPGWAGFRLQHVARQVPSTQTQWLWDTCSGAPCMRGLPGSGTHLCLLPWQVDSMLLSTREARIPLVLTEASFEWDAWSHTDCPPSPGTLLRPGASPERQLPIHLLK